MEIMDSYAHKKLLMLCYYFPPLLDVGCKRSYSFAKYLKKHGWEPHVLSVRNPDKHYCLLGNEKPPEGVPTDYTRSVLNLCWIIGKINGLFSRLFKLFKISLNRNYAYELIAVPDYFIGWVPGAVIKGYRLILKNKLDIIYVSCTPYSSALAGMMLKKLTGKPLVIDFRDPFSVSIPAPDHPIISPLRIKINRIIERAIIDAADLFIVNTEEVREAYINEYPDIAGKTFTIHNGFDIEGVAVERKKKFEKFTIVYGGNLYYHLKDSEDFFKAIALLKGQGGVDEDNFQFLYYGHNRHIVEDVTEKLKISGLVRAEPMIPHQAMLDVLMRSHLQLLRIFKPMISTKFFEGIALNVPFLATIPEGEVADLIRKYSHSSRLITEGSPEAIAEAIQVSMQDYRQGAIQDNFTSPFLNRFSREILTRRLEYVIECHMAARKQSVTLAISR